MEVTATTIAIVRTAGSAARERGAISLSIAAITAARLGDGAEEFAALATMPERELWDALPTDREKLAFWINVYNAGIQRELCREPENYRHRFRFFSKHGVDVAGRHLSFNAMEHGILRRSMFAYSLGYASNPFPRQLERELRLGRRDPRVHFALNCGARARHRRVRPQAIDSQLDVATRSYLESETGYDRAKGVVTVPRVFLWFRGDFGGRAGTKNLLRRFGVVPPDANPRLRYGGFDWSLVLDKVAPR